MRMEVYPNRLAFHTVNWSVLIAFSAKDKMWQSSQTLSAQISYNVMTCCCLYSHPGPEISVMMSGRSVILCGALNREGVIKSG